MSSIRNIDVKCREQESNLRFAGFNRELYQLSYPNEFLTQGFPSLAMSYLSEFPTRLSN